MAKAHLITVALMAWISAGSQTPITIGNSNMPGNNDTLRYTTVQVSSLGNYTTTGTNMSWDFSAASPLAEGVRSFKSASQTPYFFLFLGANEFGEKIADTIGAGPLVMTNYFNFYKKQTTPVNAFVADGSGLTFSSIPVPSYFSDKDELYVFPLTYPKSDSTTFRFSTLTTTLLPINYSKTGYRITVVDGWGTVTTPYGTENCLRVVTTQYSRDTMKITLFPLPPIGLQNNVRSYQWLTLNSKIPFMEVSGNLMGNNFMPTQARYRGYFRKEDFNDLDEKAYPGNMSVYPNPAGNLLLVKSDKMTGPIEIFDASGRLILSLAKVEADQRAIDISNLRPGVYFLQTSGLKPMRFVKE